MPRSSRLVVALVACLVMASPAGAALDELKCRRGIVKAAAKFAQAYAKATASCELQVLAGNLGTCPDGKTSDKITKAEASISAAIANACAGLTPTEAGFGATCPGVDGTCGAPIASLADVATCITCAHEQTVDSFEDALFQAFAMGNPLQHKCHRAVAKSANKRYAIATKMIARCEDDVLTGKVEGPCPTYVPAFAKAAALAMATVCQQCGGADHACDGVGDVSVGQIGFTSCPAVPSESIDCNLIVMTSLDQMNTCLGCVLGARIMCANAVTNHATAVPAYCDPVP